MPLDTYITNLFEHRHYRYITVTLPLHYRYITVTSPTSSSTGPTEGCNPVRRRLQPYEAEAATLCGNPRSRLSSRRPQRRIKRRRWQWHDTSRATIV